MPYTPEEIARVGETIKHVRAKAIAALRPIQREMQIMGWGAELQAAMWREVADIGMGRWADAVATARSGGPVSGQEPDGAGRDVQCDSVKRSRPVDLKAGK